MTLYENIKDNLKESEENYGPVYVWRTYLNGDPSDDYTSYEEALKDAKEKGCEEIEKYTWYNSNDYDNYKDADKVETIWTNTMNESEEDKPNEHLLDLLRTKDKIARDTNMPDDIAYNMMEKIDNEMVNAYSIEEIEKAEKYLGFE